MRALTLELVQEKLKNIHGGKVQIKPDTYTRVRFKATFIDAELGAWEAQVFKVLNGQGHPALRGKKALATFILNKGHSKKIPEKYWEEKKSKGLSQVTQQLLKKFGDQIQIVPETYRGKSYKATFIDRDFGEWVTEVRSVLKGRGHPRRAQKSREETMVNRYGFKYCAQIPCMALRQAKALNKSQTIRHWKTGQELVCVGSYEVKAILFLNENQIEFEWQPKVFTMPDGKTYRPDLFLIEKKMWVEIKGFMRKDAKLKWEWFKTLYPSAELWDQKKLKEIGVLKHGER